MRFIDKSHTFDFDGKRWEGAMLRFLTQNLDHFPGIFLESMGELSKNRKKIAEADGLIRTFHFSTLCVSNEDRPINL